MKKVIFTTFTLLIFVFNACDDFLSLSPKSDLTSESFWKTESDANVSIISIYHAFSNAMSSGLWDWGEVRADNFDYYERNAAVQRELVLNNILIDNPAASWTELYDVIGKANIAIKFIPTVKMTPSLRDHFLGEAYAMRAWAYFYCVRLWGDVPLYLEPVEELSQGIFRERTNSEYIIDKVIIPDLEKAYFYIDKTNLSRNRMNVATISLLLMDVYSWIGNHEMVVLLKEERINLLDAASDDRINNDWLYLIPGGLNYINDWRELFINSNIESSSEVWFKVSYDKFGNGENQAKRYFGTGGSKLNVSMKLKNAYEGNDLRRIAQWNGDNFNKKFWPDGTIFSGTGSIYSENDLVIYRYADVVLLYAEALNEMGRTEEALNELNKTRVRAGNEPFTGDSFNSKEELADAIFAERQKEFVGEGKRWFDLVRSNRWQEHSQLADSAKIVFPVHRDHLNQNPELTQNYPAYPYP